MALVPYLIVVAVFGICKLGIPSILAQTDIKIAWPIISGGAILSAAGKDPGTTFTLNLLSTPGTMLLVAGLIAALVYTLNTENGRYKMTMGAAMMSSASSVLRLLIVGSTVLTNGGTAAAAARPGTPSSRSKLRSRPEGRFAQLSRESGAPGRPSLTFA
jgi:lactate permease